MIKITIETDDLKATVEDLNGVTLTEALELFGNAVRAVGYRYNGEIVIEDYEGQITQPTDE